MAKIGSLVVSLSANSAKLNKDLATARKRTKRFSRDVSLDFKKIGIALAGIASGAATKGIVDITARYEDLRTTLGSVFGSAKNGAQAFEAVKTLSTQTQFGIEDLSKTFIKLRSAGIQPTQELMKTFTDVAAVTTDQVGSLEAITDLFSRTTAGGLGLEDLNRLADRGVPVFDIIQQKLGLTRLEVAEFGKTAQGAQKILEAISTGINERFGGATANRLQNMSTLMSNFDIAVKNASDSMGQGFAPALKQAIADSTDFITNNDELARSIGETLGEALTFIIDTLKVLKENMDLVLSAAAMAGYSAAVKVLTGSITALKNAFIALGVAIRANPIGIAVTAVAGAITYFNGFGRTMAQVSAAVGYLWQKMKDFGNFLLDLVKTPIRWLGEAFDWINEKLGLGSDGVDSFASRLKELAQSSADWASDALGESGFITAIRKAGEEYDKAAEAALRLKQAQQGPLTITQGGGTTAGGGAQGGGYTLPPLPTKSKGGDGSQLFTMKDKKAFSEALSGAIVSGIREKSGWQGIKESFAESMQNHFFDKMSTSLDTMIGDFMDGLTKSLESQKGTSGSGGWLSSALNWGMSLFSSGSGTATASPFSKGGIVPQYLAGGGFARQGTDTVPAMLTPGEVVLNAAQQKNLAGAMGGSNVTINISGNVDQRAIDQIKKVVASDPVMIHQLNRNGENSTTGLRRKQ